MENKLEPQIDSRTGMVVGSKEYKDYYYPEIDKSWNNNKIYNESPWYTPDGPKPTKPINIDGDRETSKKILDLEKLSLKELAEIEQLLSSFDEAHSKKR